MNGFQSDFIGNLTIVIDTMKIAPGKHQIKYLSKKAGLIKTENRKIKQAGIQTHAIDKTGKKEFILLKLIFESDSHKI
jgi:hypothetical protein